MKKKKVIKFIKKIDFVVSPFSAGKKQKQFLRQVFESINPLHYDLLIPAILEDSFYMKVLNFDSRNAEEILNNTDVFNESFVSILLHTFIGKLAHLIDKTKAINLCDFRINIIDIDQVNDLPVDLDKFFKNER